jgi:hypothetical protein
MNTLLHVNEETTLLTQRLKARIAEPEQTLIARQRLGKQVAAATNIQATIEVLLSYNNGNGVFCWSRSKDS